MSRYRIHLIELEDGFTGSMEEVAKHLGVYRSVVSNAVCNHRKKIAKKYDYRDLGVFCLHTIYQVSDETGIKFEGDKTEIAKRLYYSNAYIGKCIWYGKLGKYSIKKSGEEYRKEQLGI